MNPINRFSCRIYYLKTSGEPGSLHTNEVNNVLNLHRFDHKWCNCKYFLSLFLWHLLLFPWTTEAQSPGHTPPPTCPLPEEVINTFSIHGDASVGTSIRYSCLSGWASERVWLWVTQKGAEEVIDGVWRKEKRGRGQGWCDERWMAGNSFWSPSWSCLHWAN